MTSSRRGHSTRNRHGTGSRRSQDDIKEILRTSLQNVDPKNISQACFLFRDLRTACRQRSASGKKCHLSKMDECPLKDDRLQDCKYEVISAACAKRCKPFRHLAPHSWARQRTLQPHSRHNTCALIPTALQFDRQMSPCCRTLYGMPVSRLVSTMPQLLASMTWHCMLLMRSTPRCGDRANRLLHGFPCKA